MYERNICSCFIYPCSLSDLCWYCRIRQGSFSQFYHMLNQKIFFCQEMILKPCKERRDRWSYRKRTSQFNERFRC